LAKVSQIFFWGAFIRGLDILAAGRMSSQPAKTGGGGRKKFVEKGGKSKKKTGLVKKKPEGVHHRGGVSATNFRGRDPGGWETPDFKKSRKQNLIGRSSTPGLGLESRMRFEGERELEVFAPSPCRKTKCQILPCFPSLLKKKPLLGSVGH